MLPFILLLLLGYLILIMSFYVGFDKVPGFQFKDREPQNKFSIIIPFRNESKRITGLLESILELNYPISSYELLFIDDDSNDQSVKVITDFFDKSTRKPNFKILPNNRCTGSPKKNALILGVSHAKHPYVTTTDADVVLPRYWLDGYDEFIQEEAASLIVGPVKYSNLHSFLYRFQALEFLSLQGSTIGAFGLNMPFMCNGANLCYKKSVFEKISAYGSNSNIASGDDVFLLEAMLKSSSEKVAYLKSNLCVVETSPVDSWIEVIHQRHRWAAKASSYKILFGKLVGITVFLMNLLLLILPILVVSNQISIKSALMVFFVKISADFLLLFKTSKFFEQTELLISYLLASLLYPIISTIVVFKSLMTSYVWKERTFKA